jgi:serine/threonine-protein kinase
MTPERYQQVKSILQTAVEFDTPQRESFLAEACNGDEELRREVESLLQHETPAAGFIEESAFEVAARVLKDEDSAIGRRIGPYRIKKEIGRGGMGVVYLAGRDDEQYQKQVAIKIIKRGMDSEAVVRRFLNERQIVAQLEHPNIARLIDGGTTDNGVPYFVMEYVDGIPIDEHCEAHNLSTEARLNLFLEACSAVQFAHQNLVIHRDLKPGNILVTATATPKLLDFGIAKVLQADASAPDHTLTALRVMTPDYASPEQVRGETITTTSDIYSLGVVLYELLTGARPYTLQSKTPEALARVISSQEPIKPSQVVSGKGPGAKGKLPGFRREPGDNGNGQSTTADEPLKNQGSKIRNSLRGDLDNIVLMAMRKEPARRYQSVAQFGEDIRRHLDGLPVIARKDTYSYRTTKFIQRHKTAVAAAVLVVLTLAAGVAATIRQAKRATAQSQVAMAERDRARREAAKAERINKFLQGLISYANPSWYAAGAGRRGDVKVIDALNDAAGRIDTELQDEPEVRAELHHTIGDTYRALGLNDQAEQHLRAALDIYRQLYGERHPKVAEGLYYLAGVHFMKGDRLRAEEVYREAIRLMREVDPDNVNLPYMLEDLGSILAYKQDPAGEALLNEALAIFRKRYGENHPTVASTYERLADTYATARDYDRAKAAYQQAINTYKLLPGSQPYDGALLHLAQTMQAKGDNEEAEHLFEEALDQARNLYGNDNPRVAEVLRNLALYHSNVSHDYARAEFEIGEAAAIQRRLDPNNIVTVNTLEFLSATMIRTGKLREANLVMNEALALYNTLRASNHEQPETLCVTLVLLKRYHEAEPICVDIYNYDRSADGENHPLTNQARQNLATLYESWGKRDVAAQYR